MYEQDSIWCWTLFKNKEVTSASIFNFIYPILPIYTLSHYYSLSFFTPLFHLFLLTLLFIIFYLLLPHLFLNWFTPLLPLFLLTLFFIIVCFRLPNFFFLSFTPLLLLTYSSPTPHTSTILVLGALCSIDGSIFKYWNQKFLTLD